MGDRSSKVRDPGLMAWFDLPSPSLRRLLLNPHSTQVSKAHKKPIIGPPLSGGGGRRELRPSGGYLTFERFSPAPSNERRSQLGGHGNDGIIMHLDLAIASSVSPVLSEFA